MVGWDVGDILGNVDGCVVDGAILGILVVGENVGVGVGLDVSGDKDG